MGRSQEDISVRVPQLNVCEIGVGYEGIIPSRPGRGSAPFFAASFCAFESHAHRNFVYGLNGWRQPRYMLDTVIPNYFDPAEFSFAEREERQGYALFLGRVVEQKGPHIAAQIAKAAGLPLIVAGPGGLESHQEDFFGWVQSPEVRVEPCRYVGPVGIRERALLLAGARVLIAPTTFSEPFGGVAVEAMMSGTPAITFPTGAFAETVVPGVSGYHFHTVAEGVQAITSALELDHHEIRDYAMSRYSLDAVRPMYEAWFDRVDGLWDGGWDAPPPAVC
jgi:glycosyltransferase involved in cell wall biosynthesis